MNLKAQFDKISKVYDSQRQKLIPCFEDFYGISIDNLVLGHSKPSILDLGSGTGLFAQKAFEKYPDAEIDLVDLSDQMLSVARKRFENCENIHFLISDYTHLVLAKKYDAIISSLSIHHLIDKDKIELFQHIFEWLKPGGIFINADQVLGETENIEKLYCEKWEEKIRSSDLTKEELENAFERVKLDKRTPLSIQLEWLVNVGFENVDCLYKQYSFVIIRANKPM